ncbi:MAG: hypothetical protein AAFW81_06160 [Pseudomonadota bacterium]
MSKPLRPLSLFDGADLAGARVHEAFGAGARAFAAMVAGLASERAAGEGRGAVVWAREARDRRALNPFGLAPFLDPDRLLIAECERPLDVLWTMEEALRLGPAALVVAELGRPPDLKASRRLQLAAEAGGATGLALVDDAPVANAAETRWFCAPSPGTHFSEEGGKKALAENTDSTRWRLSRIKNKKGTLGAWEIKWDAEARRVIVVSRIAGGSDAAARPRFGPGHAFRGRPGREERAAALFSE